MLKKRIVAILLIGFGLFYGYQFYINHYSAKGIFTNVTERNGYDLQVVKERETVEFFIKPEWIPFEEGERKELDEVLMTKNNTNIVLTDIWNRGNDIYFSFDTTYNLDYDNGTFMYNGKFNEDGTFTAYGFNDEFKLYNKNNNSFDEGQTGSGPNSAFSFGIEPDQFDLMKEGFTVQYSAFFVYEYNRN